jgi:hypothetical protein
MEMPVNEVKRFLSQKISLLVGVATEQFQKAIALCRDSQAA